MTELKEEITNIFKEAKYYSYLSPHPLNKTLTDLNTTFNIISVYNFWIQDYPEYRNHKISRAKEWLDDILSLFDDYQLYLEKISELLIYAKNGIWHPELFDSIAINSFKQDLNQNLFGFKLTEIIKYSKIQYFIYQHQLIFTLTTPRQEKEETEIFKIYALPIDHNLPINPKPTIFIKSEIQYMGHSHNKNSYFIADHHYLDSCKRIEHKLICNHPLSWLDIHKNPICEIQIFMGKLLNSCEYLINFDSYPLWTPLDSRYGWLYSSPSLQQVKIECPNKPNQIISLLDNGILEINPECQMTNSLLFNKSKNLKKLGTDIIKPQFKISLKSIAPYLLQMTTKNPLHIQEMVMEKKFHGIQPLSLFEFKINILNKIHENSEKILQIKENYQHEFILKIIIGLTVSFILNFIIIIIVTTKLYLNHKIMKNITLGSTHLQLDLSEDENLDNSTSRNSF